MTRPDGSALLTPDITTNKTLTETPRDRRGMVEKGDSGGDRGTRTPNLGIANAALSQLSYIPTG